MNAKRISLILGGALITAAALTPSAWAVSGAAFTTVDEVVDGLGHCGNGNPTVNCNIYNGEEFVWLNGGPAANGLGPDGQYFFAVLVPGGQPDPNDASTVPDLGTNKNLSDDFDAYTNRTFTITSGEVSTYSGAHTFDIPFIRVFPYADTTNPGGVYILAICYIGLTGNNYPVDPSTCKYDAFRVRGQQSPPPPQQGEIDVFKFCDENANGILDPAELTIGLQGWQINFTPDPNLSSGTTNANGLLTCLNLATDTYGVGETLQTGFSHTASCVDGFCGTCSVTTTTLCNAAADCPGGETCVPNPINPASITITGGDTHNVDFGNVGLSTISGHKFDDRNTNGVDNGVQNNEPGIKGIKVLLTGTADNGTAVNKCTVTDFSGNYSFPSLLPGTYTVSEVRPAGTLATTPTSCPEDLDLDSVTCAGTSKTCSFGNVCQGAAGGLTLGFWSNNNGQALLTALDFTTLTALNLRNANGSNRDFTGTLSQNKTALKNWLLSATATNMAYMLSAQLATMELNVRHGFVSSSALVFAGTAPTGCSVPGLSGGFISINDLMADANAELAYPNGYTVALNPERSCQEYKKNALDNANNNRNFVVACPTSGFGASCP